MTFQRSPIPGEDIRRAMEMPARRRELIAQSSSQIPQASYGVNELAASLHPGIVRARISEKRPAGVDCCVITLQSLGKDGRFAWFRAGQFITLSAEVGDSFISRPYSLSSSPKQALEGIYEITVQKKGIFSRWLIEEARIGEIVLVNEPSGDFYHDSLRDHDHILAIAGGSGVTPFIAMMKAIREGSEDFRLTLLYGVRTLQHLLFKPEEYENERIRVIPVLSDEQSEGYFYGFIDRTVIAPYLDDDTTVFMCGPEAMYGFTAHELAELNVEHFRRERNSVGNRAVDESQIFRLKVHVRDEVYEMLARSEETLITALERARIPAPVRCKNGVCGYCHSRLISGEYFVDEKNDFRREADRKFGYLHPCVCYPLSDMEIEIPILDK